MSSSICLVKKEEIDISKIITCSGFIGAGKSTFIKNYSRYLRDTYGVTVHTYMEFVEDNELLTLMYEEPKRWTYTSQVRFLADKLSSMKKALEDESSIVLVERDYRDQKVFIDAQLAYGCVTKLEYDSYIELYNACSSFLPSVMNYYFEVPLETCLLRMQERGRSCEFLGSSEYYRILYLMYENEYKYHPNEYRISDAIDIDTYRRIDRLTFKGVYNG